MNAKTQFDFNTYLQQLVATNKTCKANGFHFCTCTGIDGMEGVLHSFQREHAFIAVDEVTTGQTVKHGGGWFQRRTITIFVLHRCRYGDEADRQQKLALTRDILRQLQSRFIIDEEDLCNDLIYLQLDNMPTTEIGAHFANGCTGLFFMLNVDEPIDLHYDASEWE